MHFCERSQCAKLARFHHAQPIDKSEPLTFPPYVGSCRAPECYGRSHAFPVGKETEAWAFGVTLIEAAAAQDLFKDMSEILSFSVGGHAMKKYPALRRVPENARLVALRFLVAAPQERLSLKDFVQGGDTFFNQLAQVGH